jgi:hypothetical protein
MVTAESPAGFQEFRKHPEWLAFPQPGATVGVKPD